MAVKVIVIKRPSLTCSRGIRRCVRLFSSKLPTKGAGKVNFTGWKYSRMKMICKASLRFGKEFAILPSDFRCLLAPFSYFCLCARFCLSIIRLNSTCFCWICFPISCLFCSSTRAARICLSSPCNPSGHSPMSALRNGPRCPE